MMKPLAIGLKFMTMGMVNIDTGKLIIKDPLTGFGNTIKTINDAIVNDFNKGIWIGKKVRSSNYFGVSSYLIENKNTDILHYVIRVDGENFHLN